MADAITIPVVGTVDAGFLGELQQLYGRLSAVAGTIAELSAEQGRLDASAARLGLSFDQSAAAAGRYVDQLVIQRAAESASQTGLRLTQTELDALTRRAAQYAEATGVEMTEAVQQLTEAVVKGESEGLNRFGGGLAEVGRQSGTAGDRLRALVTDANASARATDDAATAAQRLSGAWRDAGRQFSAAFTDEAVANLTNMGANAGSAADRVDDLKVAMRALGAVAADVAQSVGGTIGVIIGGVGIAIRGALDGVQALYAGISTRARGGTAAEARAAASAAWNAGGEGRDDILNFMRRAGDAVSDVADGTTDNARQDREVERQTLENANRTATRIATEVLASVGFNADGTRRGRSADQQARGRRAGGSSGSSQRMSARDIAIARSEMDTATEAKVRTQSEAETQLARDLAEMSAANDNKSLGSARAEMEESAAQKAAQSERTAADERIASERSLTAALREQFRERATAAQTMAGSIRGAYDSMTSAAGEHLAALVLGQETLGQALQGMLHDTLAAVAKEASIKAILETAAGIASLASFNYPSAAQHFAAAGVFAAAAVAAGAGAQATAPSAQSSGAGAGASSRAASSAPDRSTREGSGTTININMSGLLAGSAQDAARQVVNLLRVGADQAGVQLPRRAVEAA